MKLTFSPVFYLIGYFLLILGLIMLAPALFCLVYDDQNMYAFLASSGFTLFIALMLILGLRSDIKELTTRQAFMLTFLTWTILSFFASLPFLLSTADLTFVNSIFESVSGLTTSGASIFGEPEALSQAFHVWRAFLAGFGGIGIIVLAIAVLPLLKIGGMQLLMTESADSGDKFLPRTTQIAVTITLLYVGLIVVCLLAYKFMGMNWFDAIVHGITTLSTSGFSTHSGSFAYFKNPGIEWVASFFMLVGSMPFILYLKMVKNKSLTLLNDTEVRFYLGVILIAIILTTLYKTTMHMDNVEDALRKATFHVISFASTTGCAVEDVTLWGSFPIALILFLSFLGGCSGSTAGGIKSFRFRVLIEQTRTQIYQLIYPRGIFVAHFNQKPINPTISTSVSNYIFVYISFLFILTMALGFFGMDVLNSFSTAVACLSNVGTSLTTELGPMGSYAAIPDGAKWTMICGMLLGRLELFSVLVIFLPVFWKD